MNAKQRVQAVLSGTIPDRVPIGEFAIDFDTVEKIIGHETYLRAKAKSQIAFWEGRHNEVAESYRRDHIELFEKLDLDIITFPTATWQIPPPSAEPPPRKVDATTWMDAQGRVYKYSELTADITLICDPVIERKVFAQEQFAGHPPPPARDTRSWAIVDAVINRFACEKYICGPSGGEIGIVMLGGLQRGSLELMMNPQTVKAAVRYELKRQHAADAVFVHPKSDAVLWGQDFCFNGGPFINPEMFRAFFLDANKARVNALHAVYGKKVIKHCCGNTAALLDDFVEIGYDAYQSIQPTAGMDLAAIKQSHGDRLTLWGGVAVEHLIAGSMEEVRRDVRTAMASAKEGGRFILGSSHSIAVGTRYDNYMAMIDEYHKWCDYR